MQYSIRPYRQGEERSVAEAHRRVYSEEYRWGSAFTDYAMGIALEFPHRERSEREELWVADAAGELAGCVMLCRTEEPEVGQLRLFLVEKKYRGCGVGTALLNTLLERARAVGCTRLVLWTASPLTDALRQYEKLGFRPVAEHENSDWSMDGETLREIMMEKTPL